MIAATLALVLLTPQPVAVRAAVGAAVPKLVAGAAGHAEQKTCFACHNQAYPALALSLARDRGFDLPADYFKTQAEHVAGFLGSNKDRFL